MAMVDDATGHAEALLAGGETLAAAFGVLRRWIERHGVPEALYTDRKNIYVTEREPSDEEQRLGTGALWSRSCACAQSTRSSRQTRFSALLRTS